MHTLICGRTKSGKSALAKQIGTELRRQGYYIVAFNPTKERGYERQDEFGCQAADMEFSDPDDFEDVVSQIREQTNLPIILIIDEGHNFFMGLHSDKNWLVTEGRHHGFTVIVITQRAANLNPTARTQCSRLYLFMCSTTDAKFLSDDWGCRELAEAIRLNPGEYYCIEGQDLDRGKVFS